MFAMPAHRLDHRLKLHWAGNLGEGLSRWRTADDRATSMRDGSIERVPEAMLGGLVEVDVPLHPRPAVDVELEAGAYRLRLCNVASVQRELKATSRARQRGVEDGVSECWPLLRG